MEHVYKTGDAFSVSWSFEKSLL